MANKNKNKEVAEFVDECNELRKKIELLNKELKSKLKEFLMSKAKIVFDRYSFLKTISWTIYTPSWCDGDPCPTYCTTDEPVINDDDFLEGYEHNNYLSTNNTTCSKEDMQNAFDCTVAFLCVLESEEMEMLFGNDVRVTLTRDGFDVDDYDCGY